LRRIVVSAKNLSVLGSEGRACGGWPIPAEALGGMHIA
jgi:hypothetical protein